MLHPILRYRKRRLDRNVKIRRPRIVQIPQIRHDPQIDRGRPSLTLPALTASCDPARPGQAA